jgi:hypothetical protein
MRKFAVVGVAECLRPDVNDHLIGVPILLPMRVARNIHNSTRNRPADLGGSAGIASTRLSSTPSDGGRVPIFIASDDSPEPCGF